MSELRKSKQLGDENTRLKRVVPGLTLDRHILQEVPQKNLEASTSARARPLHLRAFPGECEARVSADTSARGDLLQAQLGGLLLLQSRRR